METVRDDSHATAILKRIRRLSKAVVTAAIEGSKSAEYKEMLTSKYSKKKKFDWQDKMHKKYLGDSLIWSKRIKPSRVGKRELVYYIIFGSEYIVCPHSKDYEEQKLIPVTMITMDSNVPFDDITQTILVISEHAAVKMIRRNNITTVKTFGEYIKKYVLNAAIISDKKQYITGYSFIVVTAEAYMPVVVSELETLLIKTWISRDSWRPEVEAKLTTLCDSLEKSGGHCQIEESVFNRALYIDPHDRSNLVLMHDRSFLDSLVLK